MQMLEFTTDAFRDSAEVRAENPNAIEGAGLAKAVREHLVAQGYRCDEVFAEDFGWGFFAEGPEGRYFCTFALDPANEDESRDQAVEMYGTVSVQKNRTLVQTLTGRNRQADTERLPLDVTGFFTGNAAFRNLKVQR